MANPNFEAKMDAALSSVTADVAKVAETPVEAKTETPVEAAETETETTTETEAPTEAQAQDTDDEPDALSVTPDELAQIKANPALAKLYKSMNKNFTQKSMALANERQLVDALRNPNSQKAVIKLMAEQVGMRLADEASQAQQVAPTQAQVKETVDEAMVELNKVLDPSIAGVFKSAFTKMAEDVAKRVLEQEVAPLKETSAMLTQEAYRAQSEAEVKAFKAAYPDVTPDVEAKMAALFDKIPPSENVNAFEYMEMLRKIVVTDTKKSDAVKEVATRMQKAAASQEPRQSVQPNRINPTPEKREKRGFDDAFTDSFKQSWTDHGGR